MTASSALVHSPIGRYVKFPVQRVHMELTNVCNFDCTFCPKSVMTRKYGYMKYETTEKIIDEIAEHNISEKITFHVMGEPFVYPRFYDVLRHCKERGLKTGITCNGTYLDPAVADKLRDLDVHQINVSLQTPDEHSFESRKSRKLKFQQYIGLVVEFLRRLKEGDNHTVVKIHFLNTRFGEKLKEEMQNLEVISSREELHDVLKEWVNKIYDRVLTNGVKDRKEKVLKEIEKVSINRWNVLEIAPEIHLETYVLNSWGNAFGDQNVRGAKFGYCSAVQDHFAILYNGDLVLCCKDFDGKNVMGNVEQNSILDILNTDDMVNVVRGFQRFQVVKPYCQKCLGGKGRIDTLRNQVVSLFYHNLLKPFFYVKKRLY
jgi:radical SAM protein with 4Fe4S-binding SPASM domain